MYQTTKRSLILVLSLLILVSCASANPPKTTATLETQTVNSDVVGGAKKVQIGLVTDAGKINDGTFNQIAYEGLVRAKNELGAQIDYIETQQPGDYQKNLERFASENYDLVICVGFLIGEAVAEVASRYSNVKFVVVDFAYEQPLPNVKGLTFKEDQAAYLVGSIAALMSEKDIIGVVGGEKIPPVLKYVEGYKAGAKSQKPEIQVREVYIPSFTDPAQGAEAAKSLIAEGVDVLFGAGGQTGSGAIQAAAQEGIFVIGVDQDEYNTTFNKGSVVGSDKIITSAIKRVDNAIFSVVQDVIAGRFSNNPYIGDVANGGVDYAPHHDAGSAITPEITAKLNEIKRGLANGSIKPISN